MNFKVILLSLLYTSLVYTFPTELDTRSVTERPVVKTEPPQPETEAPQPETEPPQPPTEAPEPGYEEIGCFKDNSGDRALPDLYANFRNSIDWYNMKPTIDACAKAARNKGYQYFSVQFYGECWSGENAGLTYNKYGPAPENSCWKGVGKRYTNFVYKVSS